MLNPKHLAIILLIFIFVMFLMVVAGEVLEVKADSLVSVCPSQGCTWLDNSYYSDYEYGSFKYWNVYCNDMKDTIFECV